MCLARRRGVVERRRRDGVEDEVELDAVVLAHGAARLAAREHEHRVLRVAVEQVVEVEFARVEDGDLHRDALVEVDRPEVDVVDRGRGHQLDRVAAAAARLLEREPRGDAVALALHVEVERRRLLADEALDVQVDELLVARAEAHLDRGAAVRRQQARHGRDLDDGPLALVRERAERVRPVESGVATSAGVHMHARLGASEA